MRYSELQGNALCNVVLSRLDSGWGECDKNKGKDGKDPQTLEERQCHRMVDGKVWLSEMP